MATLRLTHRTSPTTGNFALEFPSNSAAENITDPYAVIEFVNPQNDGLPLWGASGAGVCWVRKIKTKSTLQPGYTAQIWWSQGDGNFSGSNGMWGAHPYPVRGYDVDNNYGTAGAGFFIHEIAILGEDVVNSSGTNWPDTSRNTTFTGTAPNNVPTDGVLVTANTTYIQGMRITRASSTSKSLRYYFNLPNVTSANYIHKDITTTYGESDPPSPKLTIGDSPWGTNALYQHERADCILDGIKIFNAVLTEQEMLDEANDFSRVVTSSGQAAIWWGRNGFDTGHDTHNGTILCHFGTGRSLSIVNPSSDSAHRINLVSRI